MNTRKRPRTSALEIINRNQKYLAMATGTGDEDPTHIGVPQVTIRGVPPHITPMLVLALKDCRPGGSKNKRQLDRQGNGQGKTVLNTLLAAGGGVAVNGQGVAAKAKESAKKSSSPGVTYLFGLLQAERPEVQVACASFLVDAAVHAKALDNSQVPWKGRRGSLKLLWLLLQRSKACREYFVCGASPGHGNDTGTAGVGNGNSAGAGASSPVRELISFVSRTTTSTTTSTTTTTAGTTGDTHNNATTNTNTNHPLQFQQEAIQMIHDLSHTFGHLYPHLVVAVRFVEEKRGIVNVMHMVKDANTNNVGVGDHSQSRHSIKSSSSLLFATRVGGGLSAQALRVGCDAAYNHGNKECQRIYEVIQKVEELMEVVYPRFLDNSGSRNQSRFARVEVIPNGEVPAEANMNMHSGNVDQKVADDNDDDDDESIEWEEGVEEEESEQKIPKSSTADKTSSPDTTSSTWEDHEAAVERTLAAMGMSRDHAVEVNFGDTATAVPEESESSGAAPGGTTGSIVERGKGKVSELAATSISTTIETEDGAVEFFTTASADHNTSTGYRYDDDADATHQGKGSDDAHAHLEEYQELQQCIQILRQKHLPTVKLWLECVLMAPSTRDITSKAKKKKGPLLRRLMDTKSYIAQVLAQSSRMGVTGEKLLPSRAAAARNTSDNDHDPNAETVLSLRPPVRVMPSQRRSPRRAQPQPIQTRKLKINIKMKPPTNLRIK
jgi:hypothetical protein